MRLKGSHVNKVSSLRNAHQHLQIILNFKMALYSVKDKYVLH